VNRLLSVFRPFLFSVGAPRASYLRRRTGPTGRPPATARSQPSERGEAAHERSVGDVGSDADERRPRAVSEHEEARRLEQGDVRGGRRWVAHPRVDEREQGVDERGTGEHAVGEAEDRSEPPPAPADREEEGVVDQREPQPEQEVQDVAERLGAGPVAREGRAQQERQVHACQVELVPGPKRGGEHHRPGESSRNGAPDTHRVPPATASAALIKRQVAGALREVPEEGTGGRVDLLGVEADVVGQPHELVHQRHGLVAPPAHAERLHEPEREVRNAPSDPSRPSSPV
jgi:hypothetical protein